MIDFNKLTEVKFDLPIYWATYIMYADESGLEDGEKEIIDEILEDLEDSQAGTNIVRQPIKNNQLELFSKS